MTQKDIAEIKKLFAINNSRIARIAGCFVDGEKQVRLKTNQNFMSLEEDERFKFLELLKAGMSGRIGKNLMDLEFVDEGNENGNPCQEKLLQILSSEIKDGEPLLDEFFQNIIEKYEYIDNYYILLTRSVYDIPVKGKDRLRQDESDDVYSFLNCVICPVKPSKPGLSYDAATNMIINAEQTMMIEKPITGFVFPAFTDRQMDIHHTLYFTKKSSEIEESLVQEILGSELPTTADVQNDVFVDTLEETLGESLNFSTAKAICETLHETEIEKKEDKSEDTPYILDKVETKSLLEKSGVEPEKREAFVEKVEEVMKKSPIQAANVLGGTKKLAIDTGKASVSLNMEDSDYVEVRMVEGRKCLVIPLTENVIVNGMSVKERLLEE